MIMLLHDMRAPTRYARHGEDWSIQFRGKLEHREYRCSVKIDIRAKTFLPFHRFFQTFADGHPMFFAQSLSQIACNLPHNRDSRVAPFVNAMTESHDFR